ncbi:MAG: thiol:disulfide interchange protein DsbA/DsbL [Gammaproteobacteria bacterium]
MRLRHLLFAILLVGLAGCDTDTTATQDVSLPVVASPEPEAAEQAADIAAAEQEAIETVEESAALEDSVEEEEILIAAVEEETAPAEQASQWQYTEGRHFRSFTASQGTSSAPDKIEVAEMFWYGCAHCYNFEPYVSNWRKTLPADVEFVQIPVMWNPTNQIHARAFYTAQALGKLDEIHTAMFREIHINNNPLTTEAALQSFFEEFGVSPEEFTKAFRSFGVNGKLKRATNFTQRYQVRSVPILVVNGKYSTDAPEVGTLQQKLEVADELVERERQRL